MMYPDSRQWQRTNSEPKADETNGQAERDAFIGPPAPIVDDVPDEGSL
jgi:hypothetical protein